MNEDLLNQQAQSMIPSNMIDGGMGMPPQDMGGMTPMHQMPAPVQPQIHHAEVYQAPPKDFFRNLIPELDPEDVAALQKKLWPKIKKGSDSNKDVASNFASFLKLMSVKAPSQSGSGSVTQTLGNGDDSYIKGSGSMELFSTALIETAMSICFNVLTILFLRDKKFDTIVGSHLEGNPDIAVVTERVVKWCDAYFTKELLPEYRHKLATSLLYAITDGDAMRKIYHCPNRGYPDAALLEPGDFFFTEEDRSFYHIRGFVHAYRITLSEMERKLDSGEWSSMFDKPISADDRKEGFKAKLKEQTGRTLDSGNDEYDEDFAEIFQGYEYYNDLHIASDPDRKEGDPHEIPYTIQVGEEGVITSIRHNFDENDPLKFPFNDYIRYSFMPSYDEHSYGLMNICGQKARAATILQRGLVDNALLANTPTGFIAPSGRVTDRTFDFKSGKFFTAPNSEGDLSKSISYMPHNEASPVILQLMQQLEGEIRQFSHVVSQDMVNLATQAPGVNLLAILQRMEQLPNAILQGFYDSFSQELGVFKRKWFEWLPAQQMFSIQWRGELLNICKEDFSPGLEIIPCGQFSGESTAYKLMRSQLILDQAKSMPQNHNLPQVLVRLYSDLGLKDDEIKKIVVIPDNSPPPPPPSMDPLTENTFLLQSKPVKSYIEQEHQAHITVHSLLLNHSDPQVIAATQAHIKEHEADLMFLQLQMASGVQVPQPGQGAPGGQPQQPGGPSQLPPDQENQLALVLAAGAEKMKQHEQQNKPIDPGLIKLEEIKMKKETAMLDAEIAMKKLSVEDAKVHIDAEVESLKAAIHAQEQVRENIRLELEFQSHHFDNEIKQHNQQLDHLTAQLEGLQKVLNIHQQEQSILNPPMTDDGNNDIINNEQLGVHDDGLHTN